MQGRASLIVGGLGAFVALTAIFAFTDIIAIAGRHIPQENVVLDYAPGVLWAMTLEVSIVLWPVPAQDRPLLRIGWLAK